MLTLILTLWSLLVFIIVFRRRRPLKVSLPPGPPSDFLLGHLRYIPSTNPEVKYAEWAKTYGDVIYLHVLNRDIIVLNSAKAATDLLEKRGENYSQRPKITIFDIMGFNTLPFMNPGKRFQRHRKLFQEYFSRQKVPKYMEYQAGQAKVLAIELAKLQEHGDIEHVLERFSTNVVGRITYGYDMFLDSDGTYDQIAQEHSYIFSHCGPIGGTPVDLFPILRYFPSWFPGTFYANRAREFRSKVLQLHNYPFEKVKKQMVDGTARPSFISDNLEKPMGDNIAQQHDDIRDAAVAMFGAGFDTTWATLSAFILAMVIHPEYQVKAREELDRVLQRSRLPEFNDRKLLPFVECIVQETFRWLPVAPLALPHGALKDDTYNDMFIPGGSIVLANLWAILRDERVYREPDAFNPSRYLPKSSGGNDEPFHDSTHFGYGRRICPGRHFADNSVWISIATVLTLFEIHRVKDEFGNEVIPLVEVDTGVVSRPKPYKCKMELRGEWAKALLDEAEIELGRYH